MGCVSTKESQKHKLGESVLEKKAREKPAAKQKEDPNKIKEEDEDEDEQVENGQ